MLKRLWEKLRFFFLRGEARNEYLHRQSLREERERIKECIRQSQQECSHLQGSNPQSEYEGPLTCIVWHQLDRDGDVIGVCLNCQRLFSPKDVDYKYWASQESGCRPSRGGQVVKVPSYDVKERRTWAPTESEFDGLTDEQVNRLFERTAKLAQKRRKNAS